MGLRSISARRMAGLALTLTAMANAGSAFAADADAAQIRAARAASNAGIAAHDPIRATGPMRDDARVLSSGGQLIQGVEGMRAAFAQSFADPQFIRFLRTPGRIDVGSQGEAAEQGRWVGEWRTGGRISGPYLARWRHADDGWKIAEEVYIPLACSGLARCKPAD